MLLILLITFIFRFSSFIIIYIKNIFLFLTSYSIKYYNKGTKKEKNYMKRTYQPNKRKMKKTHGFFSRKGGKVLASRRRKGRKVLSK